MQSTTIINPDGTMSVHRNPEEAERAMHLHRTRHISERLARGDTEGQATQSAMAAYTYGPSVTECVAAIIKTLYEIERDECANVAYSYSSNPGFLEIKLTEYGSSHLLGKPRKLVESSFSLADREAARDLYRFNEWLRKEWLK